LITVEAVHNVREPAGFAEFTVAHDVDSHLRLLVDDLGDGFAEDLGSGCLIGVRPERQHLRRTDQATRERGQDAIGTALLTASGYASPAVVRLSSAAER